MRAILLGKRIIIHVCKDGTFTWRKRDEPSFNGRALPVYSVDTESEAEAIQLITCWLVPAEHPQLQGKPWYKVNEVNPCTQGPVVLDESRGVPTRVLELDDLDRIGANLHAAWKMLRQRHRSRRREEAFA